MPDPLSERPLHLKIDLRWIETFTEWYNTIVQTLSYLGTADNSTISRTDILKCLISPVT